VAEFLMPILGADMTAGTLIKWRKQPGDTVKRGEIIAEVETEKGLIDVEVFMSGVIERLVIEPGQTVPTGTVLAIVREEPGTTPAGAVTAGMAPPSVPVRAGRPESLEEIGPPTAGPLGPPASGRVKISPLARRLAAQLGIDPAGIKGTGVRGAVTREDVERAAVARPATGAPTPQDRQTRMRRTIGAAMARSKREVPHFYLATTIDMHRVLEWLRVTNVERPVTERLLPGVVLVKAAAVAVREVPELNAAWMEDRVVLREAVHVGVAISLRQGGVVAPALHDADRRSLPDLMRGFRDLVQRARAGGLRSSELSEGTITVTSLGEQGVETVFGVIYPPQVALVGFGKIVERPWSLAGAVVSRPVVTATLSADHRVTDGHRAGLFLSTVDRLLQEPDRL
jgi:pyruvate dehydrogenase E2 component (dihydrolipoamide acetyltransferase)